MTKCLARGIFFVQLRNASYPANAQSQLCQTPDEFGCSVIKVGNTNPQTTNKNHRQFIAHNREEQVKYLHPAQQTCAAKNMSERIIDSKVERFKG